MYYIIKNTKAMKNIAKKIEKQFEQDKNCKRVVFKNCIMKDSKNKIFHDASCFKSIEDNTFTVLYFNKSIFFNTFDTFEEYQEYMQDLFEKEYYLLDNQKYSLKIEFKNMKSDELEKIYTCYIFENEEQANLIKSLIKEKYNINLIDIVEDYK